MLPTPVQCASWSKEGDPQLVSPSYQDTRIGLPFQWYSHLRRPWTWRHTGISAFKTTSVINGGSSIRCVVHWPRNNTCNTSLTTLSSMLWAKRKMEVYTWWLTLTHVRILHHHRDHSQSAGVGSKHTPSTVTIIASSTSNSGTGANMQQCTARWWQSGKSACTEITTSINQP